MDWPAASSPPALAERTSLGVGGRSERFFEPANEAEAVACLRALHAAHIPWRVLGGGYNLLVGDDTLSGAVVSTRRLVGVEVFPDRVVAAAGHSFPSLVRQGAEWGIAALAGCPGIPGSVGGVVRMNAGGRFGCVGDALMEVRGLEADGTPFTRRVEAGDLGYRTSIFADRLVLAAAFRRDPAADRVALAALHSEARDWKRATQPLGAASAGCIFRNPSGGGETRSAGRLIDEAGLKGHRIGGAEVSLLHGNFIVNVGGATSRDVHALIDYVRQRVEAIHGIQLALEVEVWQ